MTRRDMLATATAGAASLGTAQDAPKNAYFELRHYQMRTSRTNQARRTADFLSKGYVPAARRAGVGPIGIFNALIAPGSPFLLMVSGYPSLASIQSAHEKLAADAEYQKVFAEYNSNADLGYVRMQNSLFRCFDAVPVIETGPATQGRSSRIFELRTYESDNEATLRRKVQMFNEAEIGIFRRCGLRPVFFGEAIVGANMPNITYMVAYENWAAREKAWQAFGADPEWQKLRGRPELSDAEIVSNISNALLRPAASSDIR